LEIVIYQGSIDYSDTICRVCDFCTNCLSIYTDRTGVKILSVHQIITPSRPQFTP